MFHEWIPFLLLHSTTLQKCFNKTTRQPDKYLTNLLKNRNRKEVQPDSILQANTPAQQAKICCKFIPAFENTVESLSETDVHFSRKN